MEEVLCCIKAPSKLASLQGVTSLPGYRFFCRPITIQRLVVLRVSTAALCIVVRLISWWDWKQVPSALLKAHFSSSQAMCMKRHRHRAAAPGCKTLQRFLGR